MQNSKKPLARNENLVIKELPDEILIYDLSNEKAHCLNQTAALIWQQCNGNNSITDITKIIRKHLNSPIEEEFVWIALDKLEKESLLEKDAEFSLESFGMSRREVIRRVGMASAVALPVVASLLNPMSVRAQTGICGQPCNATTPCIACGGTMQPACQIPGNICLAVCNSGTNICRAG